MHRFATALACVLLPLSAYAALSTLSPEIPPQTSFNAHSSLPHLSFERNFKLKSGQTLAEALKQSGFSNTQTSKVMQTLTKNNVPTNRLRAGTEISLNYTESAPYTISEANLSFRHGPGQIAHLTVKGEQASARLEVKELKQGQGIAVGRINDSLYQDATDAGLPPQLVKQFMDIFAWDIDYTRDIHPGDTFKVAFEEVKDDRGQRVKTGRILAASFTVGKETRQAFWFQDENGRGDYYSEKGETKRKLLLRTPLEVYRISSNFGLRRHPVLGFSRLHKGTDFAAPTGTPVKASGDGKVVFAGRHGGHGNYVKIQHTGTYSTAYAHLHRFAKGIRNGSPVKQGQIIAYVGSTGISTGPHLHYEVIKNGQFVDAMRTDLPTGVMMAGKSKQKFHAMVASIQSAWNKAFQVAENTPPAKPSGKRSS